MLRLVPILFSALLLYSHFSSASINLSPPTTNFSEIAKSPNDQREYHSFVLENQLEVLLISDPSSDKSAAALDVNIGSSDDPLSFQGLAHFLEHMLFLGTKKYPDADEYQKFISDHGGSHNAYTSLEHTNYFFDIQSDNFEGALDRFSQQFTNPLFNNEYVEREVNAVHSEYTSKLKDDGRRFFSAIKSIFSPSHPYSKFSVGNLETLKDLDKKKLRTALLDFYHANYSANQMRLVVLGKESLTTLEKWVSSKFSDIPNNDVVHENITQSFFDADFLPAKLEVESIMDKRSLTIAFPIPSAQDYRSSQPISYLANLIGHEGKGSLLSTLKAENLVDTLSAGGQFDTNDKAMLLLSLTLTETGLTQQPRILEVLFSYLDLIKREGIKKIYFDEQAKMLKTSFNYQEKSEPIHYVSALANGLQNTAAKKILSEGYELNNYDPTLYKSYLDKLNPQNMLIAVSAKNLTTDKLSTWYEAPYRVQTIEKKLIETLSRPKDINSLKLPEKNIFIPEDISLLPVKTLQVPELLKASDGIEVWYASDESFGTPKANLFLTLRSPAAMESASSLNQLELMVSLLKDKLNEFSYPAYLAGLHYELYNHTRGITVKISGYNDRQSILLNKIINTLMHSSFSQDRFDISKERLRRKLENHKQKKPYGQAISKAQNLLLSPAWSEAERLESIPELSLKNIEAFRTAFLSELDIAVLSSGNTTRASTLNMAQQIESLLLLNTKKITVERSQVTKLEGETNWHQSVHVEHPDTGFVYYIQAKNKTYKERAMMLLLSQILSTEYYGEIRTQKQLGYIVFATNFSLMEIPGLAFIVQSPNADGKTLINETQSFLSGQLPVIKEISATEVERYQSAVVSRLLKNHNTLYDKSNKYWNEIDTQNFAFDTREQIATAVKNISTEDIYAYYKDMINSQGNALTVFSYNEEVKLEGLNSNELNKELTVKMNKFISTVN